MLEGDQDSVLRNRPVLQMVVFGAVGVAILHPDRPVPDPVVPADASTQAQQRSTRSTTSC